METILTLRIILENPPPGVDFGLQKGKGSRYETIQIQRSTGENLVFEAAISVKTGPDALLIFKGPYVQGPPAQSFLYIDIGTAAGQLDSIWSRRLKIPLYGISQALIQQALQQPAARLDAKVPGTAKDGGPNCATVKPFAGFVLNSL